jgi:hypothetical protein
LRCSLAISEPIPLEAPITITFLCICPVWRIRFPWFGFFLVGVKS